MDPSVDCDGFLEALSASLDDELDLAEEIAVTAHLGNCDSCRATADQFSALTRRVRLREAIPAPDLAFAVMARARPARLGRGGWMRPALAWVAVVMGLQSVGPLFSATVDGVDSHAARHLGAFALALAVGLAYVAWRPHRAFGLLPFAVALMATTIAAAAVDMWTQRSNALAESVHLTEMIGVTILWMIAGSPGWERVIVFLRFRRLRVPRALRT
jgi:predicted anti-sigma-YlaC factor YlaD